MPGSWKAGISSSSHRPSTCHTLRTAHAMLMVMQIMT